MRVKGLFISSTLEYVKMLFGETAVRNTLNKLKEEEKRILNLKIHDNSWFTYELYLNLSQAFLSLVLNNNLNQIHKIGEYSANEILESRNKKYIRIGSPDFFLGKIATAFADYFDLGELKLIEHDKNSMFLELSSTKGLDPIIIELIAGWLEKIIEISGGRNPKITAGKTQENESIQFKGSWE